MTPDMADGNHEHNGDCQPGIAAKNSDRSYKTYRSKTPGWTLLVILLLSLTIAVLVYYITRLERIIHMLKTPCAYAIQRNQALQTQLDQALAKMASLEEILNGKSDEDAVKKRWYWYQALAGVGASLVAKGVEVLAG